MINKILIWLVGVLSLVAAIFRGNALKEKAKAQEKRADAAEGIIEDVENINRVINDSDERDRVRNKYTHKK